MKAIKIYQTSGMKQYRFGEWFITVASKTVSKSLGCGMRKSRTVTDWHAMNTERKETHKSGYGGIRDAVKKLSEHE